MTNEEKVMLQLVAGSVTGQGISIPKTCDYDALIKALNIQVVTPFISPIAKSIPDTIAFGKIKQMQYACVSKATNYLKEHNRLTNLFEDAGIKLVIMKGLATARYYPNPMLRTCGDIDCIVQKEDFYKAVDILLKDGYVQNHQCDDNECHVTFNKKFFSIELHKQWISASMSTVYDTLNSFVFAGFEAIEKVTIMGMTFYSFPKLQNGMIILQHTNRHMMQGIGLRQVLDWLMFANKEMDDVYWNGTFKHYADEFGLTKFAITLTRMCQIYLGLSETRNTWCKDADPKLCDELMEFVLRTGNLGHNASSSKGGQIATVLRPRNFKKRFKNLQRRGLDNWELAKKHTILRPFAWIYQLFRFVNRGLKGSNGIGELISDLSTPEYF